MVLVQKYHFVDLIFHIVWAHMCVRIACDLKSFTHVLNNVFNFATMNITSCNNNDDEIMVLGIVLDTKVNCIWMKIIFNEKTIKFVIPYPRCLSHSP
jgi:hypothetical protein